MNAPTTALLTRPARARPGSPPCARRWARARCARRSAWCIRCIRPRSRSCSNRCRRRSARWSGSSSSPSVEGEVLVELSDDVRAQLIREMEPEELAAATEDLRGRRPRRPGRRPAGERHAAAAAQSMDQPDRERLNRVLAWPEDSAGGLMNTDTVSVRADAIVEVVLRYLRMRGELPQRTDSLFIVDRAQPLPRRRAAGAPADRRPRAQPLAPAWTPTRRASRPRLPAHEVAQLFQRPRPGVRRGGRRTRACCSAASPSMTSSTSSARKPRTRSWHGRPARRGRRVRRRARLDAPAPAVAGHQPGHRLPGRRWWCGRSRAPSRRSPRWRR